MALPRFVVLRSANNEKYLQYVKEDGKARGFLRFSGEQVLSPYSKFNVENAKCGKGLVNIKCCYNNKYWVRSSTGNNWIVAGADEPEEDNSKWSCTLFEAVDANDGGASNNRREVRFRHVQNGNNACLMRQEDEYKSCLIANWTSPDADLCDVCTIIDWETLLMLPKHVTFKGDNGYYLSARMIEGHPYLQFASNDIGDETVGFKVFTLDDGSIRIKSNYFDKFWKRNPNWIWADSDATTWDDDNIFWPVKVDNENNINVVALSNFGNGNYCTRLTTEGKESCLNASSSTINKWAHLEMEQLVRSREINNIEYSLNDAKIYNKTAVTMATANARNDTDTPYSIDLKLSFKNSTSKNWKNNYYWKLGSKVNVSAGIPLIADGKVEISGEFGNLYEWGETDVLEIQSETVMKVTVLPKTKVKATMTGTKGSCDIPFTYTQSDRLIDGTLISYTMDDGVYTATNCFNFSYELHQENL